MQIVESETSQGALLLRNFGECYVLAPDGSDALPEAFASAWAEMGDDLTLYALLDAAQLTNLPELLDVAELPAKCLFAGEAQEDLADVAPYLVQLPRAHAFTRNLFTHDPDAPAPWQFGAQEVGVFILSRADLKTLHSHFRRFTRLSDTSGRWYYVRFQESDFLANYLQAVARSEIATRLFDYRGGRLIDALLCKDRLGDVWCTSTVADAPICKAPLQITEWERGVIAEAMETSSNRRAARSFIETFPEPLQDETIRSLAPKVAHARMAARVFGIKDVRMAGTFMLLACVHLPLFYEDREFRRYWSQSQKPPPERFSDFLASLKLSLTRSGQGDRVWW